MSVSVSDLKPEDRERLVKEVLNELRKLGCECTVECPFKQNCCLCIRNHRMDGTLPACCLPRIAERHDTSKYPDCRTPLLWVVYYGENPDKFMEDFNRLSDGLKSKIISCLKRLMEAVR